jgi:hypothetical protein
VVAVTEVASVKEAAATGAVAALPNGPPAAEALADLRAALDRMDKAARAAGVEEDDALAAWIATLKAALECSATITLEGEARIRGFLAALEIVTREDRLRMKQATERCTVETLKLERMFGTMEVRSHNLVTQTIHSMADRVAEQMRDRMVIVERRHNRIVLWRRAGVLTAAVAAIFLVGFVAAEYSDRGAITLMDRCMAHPFVNSDTGGLVCDVGSPRPGG